MTSKPAHQTDRQIAPAVIAGGGLVGMTQALALAGLAVGDERILLVDAAKPSTSSDDDLRASAITAASRRMLARLGIWQGIEKHAQPVSRMLISDSGLDQVARPPFLEFVTGDTSVDGGETAAIIENRHLLGALRKAIIHNQRIKVIAPDKVTGFDAGPFGATVTLEKSGPIETRVVIAADGSRSSLRRIAGIKTIDWDYGQTGIVATIALGRAHKGRAVQHFLPAGPFAMLPLVPVRSHKDRASLVWTEETADAKDLLALDSDAFRAALQLRLGHQFGDVEVLAGPQSFPLAMTLARSFIAERLVLIGDAAHRVHPLAGQGANMGFKDIAALTETLIEARRLGLDFGQFNVLEGYEKWRRFDVVSGSLAMDGLNRLFSNDAPLVRQARDTGLGIVDRLAPLKELLTSEAAGEVGKIPELMQVEAD